MTSDRLELLLALGIVAVYLLDALRFLGHRQVLVERRGADRWLLRFGAVRFELAGRRPVLPNPLRPDRLSWQADWRLQEPSPESRLEAIPTATPAEAPLGWICMVLLWVVVVIAPAMLVAGYNLWFAAAIATGYLTALGGAMLVVLRAQEFGLTRGAALGVAVIAVLCLPCAPNLLRASAARRSLSVSLPGFADASRGDAERRSFRRGFARVLRQELLQGFGSPQQDAELNAVLRRLEGPA